MKIEPKLYISRKGIQLVENKSTCEICSGPATIKRKLTEINLIHVCRGCHNKINGEIRDARKNLKLYNPITPMDIVNKLKIQYKTEKEQDEIINEWPTDPNYYK